MAVDFVRLLAVCELFVDGVFLVPCCSRGEIVEILYRTPPYTLLHLFLLTETWQKEQCNLCLSHLFLHGCNVLLTAKNLHFIA